MYEWATIRTDENSIRSLDAADRATRNAKSLRSLRRRACEWEPNLDQEPAGTTLVAGAGADLYSGLQCPNPVCQKHSIDKLFRRVWHYFDQVVVVDDLTHDLAHHWKPGSEDELRNRLLTRIDVLLHLRSIGGEELVQFREKHTKTSDWRRELRSEHITAIAKASRGVLNSLRKGTSVGISVSEGTTWVELRFPELSFSQSIGFDEKWASTLTIGELKRAAVDKAWDDEMLFLAGDIIQARKLRSALGCVHATHQRVLARVGEVTPESIAFELNFPILDGVPIATPLKMRRAEADLFSRLRTRLRAAFANTQPIEGG